MSRNVIHHEFSSVPIHRADNALISLQSFMLESAKRKTYNESPVLHTPLTQHNGIEITGTFKTDDATTDGQFSYVTVLKNHNSPIAWDGLGLAWRKGNGNNFNVYIVDNDALEEDVLMLGEQVIQTGGINKFLAAGKCEIEINTTYYFKIRITETYGVTVYIDAVDASAQIVATGDVWASTTVPAADGTDFGVSVLTAQGYRWWYDNIKIRSTVSSYAHTLMKFYTPSSSISDTQQGRLYVNAIGTWNVDACSGIHALVYNVDNTAYELLDTSRESQMSLGVIDLSMPSGMSSYRDSDNYVNVLLTTVSGYDDSTVSLNYASLDNILLSGINTGNFTDIYVNSPDDVVFETFGSTPVTDDKVQITSSVFTLPVANISDVRTTGGDAVEFKVFPGVKSTYGSMSTNAYIQLYGDAIPGGVVIDYRYLTTGSGMQELVQSSEFRAPGQNNLIKVNPMVLITFDTLLYTGGPSEDVLKTKLIKWINAITTTLELSDLIAYLYELGVTYIDLSTLRIEYTCYNYIGTISSANTKLTTSYTLSDMESFYTDDAELSGISRTS